MEKTLNRIPTDSDAARALRGVQLVQNESREASTLGWDTVFAITYSELNAAILASDATPSDFTRGPVSADFDAWEIIQGGDGAVLRMRIPMRNLTYLTNRGNAEAVISVRLTFVPDSAPVTQAANGSAKRRVKERLHLQLRASSKLLAKEQDRQMPAIEIINITYDNDPTPTDEAVIRSQLDDYLNGIDDFGFIFASVNVNEKAAVDDFDWMTPTQWSYAVSDTPNSTNGVFGVMAILDGDTEGLAHQVSGNVIPEGSTSAFLISKQTYLLNMLMDGMELMFSAPEGAGDSWPKDYFELAESGNAIRNCLPLKIDSFEVQEGNFQPATIPQNGFILRFQNDCLEMELLDLAHPMPGFWGAINVYDVHHYITQPLKPQLAGAHFSLTASDGTDNVLVTKNSTAEWIEVGVLFAVLAMNIWGVASAIKSVRTTTPVAGGNSASSTSTLTPTPNPAPDQVVAATQQGATVVTTAITTGQVSQGGLMSGLAKAFESSHVVKAAGILDLGLTIYGVAEAIATLHPGAYSQAGLPTFKDFAKQVMAEVTWPTAASEFTPSGVAFNGGLQVAGNLQVSPT